MRPHTPTSEAGADRCGKGGGKKPKNYLYIIYIHTYIPHTTIYVYVSSSVGRQQDAGRGGEGDAPHATIYVSSCSSIYICVLSILILLYMCPQEFDDGKARGPHTTMCPHTPTTTMHVFSYYYTCVVRCSTTARRGRRRRRRSGTTSRYSVDLLY